MIVQTTRFGMVEVDGERIIRFPSGLLGFSSFTSFVLLQPDEQGVFFWLQSTQNPDLAFVVTDPTLWIPDFHANIRREQMEELGLENLSDAQVFVIVNKRDQALTANMQGPLVINTISRSGVQLVLAEKRWTTRYELMRLVEPVRAVSA
ncbi:MAG: flagellar assembly protein FliW [Phycisphaerales bacterium]|nr:flagellar assembly protein FliW [Phycisphaerales bacterium]